MSTVTRPGPIQTPRPPANPSVVVPRASLNDNGQSVLVNPSGLVVLSGAGVNRGTVMASLSVEFDGRRLNVPVSRGQTPAETMAKLGQALPQGYELKREASRAFGDGVAFTIERKAGQPTPPPARSNVAEIDAQFARAAKKASTAGVKVGVNELRKAVALAEKGGLSAEDKDALARNWAGLFNGAGWRATPAAQKEFAKLQEQLELPVYPVR